jgi:ATP-binding cassette subfamily F protein 1
MQHALRPLLPPPQVWVVEDGTIRTYPGDFADYRAELVREITAELDEE